MMAWDVDNFTEIIRFPSMPVSHDEWVEPPHPKAIYLC